MKDDLLNAYGPRVETVLMPDGREVRVRRLMASEGLALFDSSGMDLLVQACVLCVVDDSDQPVFSDGDREEVARMGMNFVAVVGSAALKVNGLIDAEDASGKSDETPGGGLPSG